MGKRFKKIVRQIHLWLGLSTGLIVFVVSITGCTYVFEEEIRDYNQKDYLHVAVEKNPFYGLESIIRNFEKLAPKEGITSIRITDSEANATVQIFSKKKKVYFFNPYNGTLVYKTGNDWLTTVLEFHRTLLLGETGRFIQGWAVVIFIVMLVSGLVLWFPGQMRLLKQSLTIKWKASGKRINYDLHNVLGFYASIFLLMIALSGTYFAFKGVKTAAAFLTGTKLSDGKKQKEPKPLVIDSLAKRYAKIYQAAALKYPGATSTNLSVRKGGELRLRMIYPYKWARNQNTFYFDQASGQLLRVKLYKNNNAADLIEATNYDLHTGKLFGFASKIIWLLASLISASLPITGFLIWWKKGRKKS